MPDEPKNPEKKLIIDEDWKTQVEAEKEAALHGEETPPTDAEQPSAAARGPLPPANLSFLVGTFHLQAAIALGLIPNPMTKKAEVQLDRAKHSIDLLTVLQQKTEGNRTPEESNQIEATLNELRWAYVNVSEQSAAKQ